MNNYIIHRSSSRGHANHGWLKANHTFSFANYFDSTRMNFGCLRVLNDDVIAADKGFDFHSHANMEIITIPLSGSLRHQDNLGNKSVVSEGEIQVMSAGTGVIHSEFNASSDTNVSILQIWIFPNKKDVQPRYQQLSIDSLKIKNTFHQILSPFPDDCGVWIHQNSWFSLANLDFKKTLHYNLNHPSNGIYIFIIQGAVHIEGIDLSKRDGVGFWDIEGISVSSIADSEILLMEVPMAITKL